MAAVDKIFYTSKLKARKAALFYFALQPFDSVIPPHPRRVKSFSIIISTTYRPHFNSHSLQWHMNE